MGESVHSRPNIQAYREPVEFFHDMLEYRRQQEPAFSVLAASRNLRRVSPALVSLILKKKRKITLDRVDEFAKLLKLTPAEKFYLRNWLSHQQHMDFFDQAANPPPRQRKEVGTGILSDWLNVYIKDFFQLSPVQSDPKVLHRHLSHLATPRRIDRCIKFLLKEGHLRRTLDGRIVPETTLAIADPKTPSKQIRQFHKGALQIARMGLDFYPPNERWANTLIVQLNEQSHNELMDLVQEFAEKLKDFGSRQQESGDRIYQMILNISPVGERVK